MLPEFLPGGKNKLTAVINRVEENRARREKGMPTVGQETRAAVARLKEKFPDDGWLTSADELVVLDEGLDKEAERQDKLSLNAANN
jgi:hypothetical protein